MLSDLLMWNKIGRIVTLLSERLDVSGERALDIFYTSRTNELLHDEHTGLYLMSDRYIVDDVIRELRDGTPQTHPESRSKQGEQKQIEKEEDKTEG